MTNFKKKITILRRAEDDKKPKAKKKDIPKKDGRKKETRGRKKVNKKEILEKLKPFLQNGLSVPTACGEARVAKSKVYELMKDDEEFMEEIERYKRVFEIAAKNNIGTAIRNGSIEVSKWWLERKCKDEFSTRVENINENHDGEVVIVKIPENGREGGEEI